MIFYGRTCLLLLPFSGKFVTNFSRRKGLADELLEKREEERGRKRDQDEFGAVDGQSQPKRARSESSHSMSSVSTISTNRSRSRSPSRRDSGHERKRRYSASSDDDSISSYSSGKDARSRSREWTRERNTRRRRQESSPGERGRRRQLSKDGDRKYRSPNRSRDRGEIARGRRSMTPNSTGKQSHYRKHSGEKFASHENRSEQARSRKPRHQPDGPGARPPRERSMSPFSKRLALTQAMNMGN